MTESTAPPVDTALTAEEQSRVWTLREWRAVGDRRTPGESRQMAIESLRKLVRNDGYVINEASVTPGEARAAIIAPDNDVIYAEAGQDPDGWLTDWTATAYSRGEDAVDSLLRPLRIIFEVPEPYRTEGGGVRVRHNLGGIPLTITALDVNGDPIGYAIATDLDEHQHHVEIVPQTKYLIVTPDPAE